MGDCCNTLDLVPVQDDEKTILQLKVVNLEKNLWKCVQSSGLMSNEAQILYKQICSCFEKLILCDMEFIEIQDVEYSLWKLHYKHIDEFRRRIRQQKGVTNSGSPLPPRPPNAATVRQNNNSLNDGFKLFLSEATKFYQDLLLKVRRRYSFLEEKSGIVFKGHATVRNCQFMCHRFLICIGDLARYKELHDNNDAKIRNWSVSATYYMKATVIWPDGGNSHNQLALLATYVGDEFLALYHCVRSLAVKEPFPDAWNNLMLLFEKNQTTFLHSVSNEVRFDLSNPSAMTRTLRKKIDKNGSGKTELWHLFIRLISFFLTKKRSEDFCCALGSTVAELEAVMETDDAELRAGLESYQQMCTSRAGPFKALQIVSVLIFVIKHQTEALKQTELESVSAIPQLESVRLSLVAAFVCIGRIVDRCLKFSSLDSCPLLPCVLVFLEWLTVEMDEVDAHCGDEKVLNASCYFADSVLKLLNLLKIVRANGGYKGLNVTTALWEDFELQGFVPLTKAHATLDFSDQIGNRKSFENGKDCRFTRIWNSAVSLANREGLSRQWFLYNPSVKTFSASQRSVPEVTVIEQRALEVKDSSDAVDEEEVILFKPITRHNSAPVQTSAEKESLNSVTNVPQRTAVDECLRRSKSLLVTEGQLNTDRECQLKTDSPDLSSMFSDFRKPETSKETSSTHTFPENSNASARGPPSLNAWVLEQGSSGTDWPKDLDSICKNYLKPIEVGANKSSSPFSPASPKYSNGAPSPLTPRLGVGTNTTLMPQDSSSDISISTGYFSSPKLIDESLSPKAPTSPGKHRPLSGMLTSSEWLRQYREKQNLKTQPQARSLTPPRAYAASPDAASIELYDRWGNPVVSVPKMNLAIPPPFSGLGGERVWEDEEPRPLLQYLKEREMWRMQQKQQSRSRSPPPPSYMKT